MKKFLTYLIPTVLILLFLTYLIGWQYPVSNGNRSGKLVKITNKGKIIKTCEGTLDLGSGDNLTWDFSVKDEKTCDQLIQLSGDFVNLSYKQTFFGFPRETKYQITNAWTSDTKINNSNLVNQSSLKKTSHSLENKDAFCSLLGSIYEYPEVYKKVKSILQVKNLYLYNKIETCNNP